MDPQVTTLVVAALGIIGTSGGTYIAGRYAKAAAAEETERLRMQLRDAERSNRQGTYHDLIAAVLKITDLRQRGQPLGKEFDDFLWLVAGVDLFAPANVSEKVQAVVSAISQKKSADEIGSLMRAMIAEMREDVTEDILSVRA